MVTVSRVKRVRGMTWMNEWMDERSDMHIEKFMYEEMHK